MNTIGPAGVHVQTMLLEATREHLARAAVEQQAAAPAQPSDPSAVILELSAAAQQLVGQGGR